MKDLISIATTADAGALANLAHHAAYTHGAYAPNSERALRSDVARFSGWCADRGSACLPAAPATVAAFVDALDETKAPATIRRAVSSIATFYRAAQLASLSEAIEVKLALKRLLRARGRAQAQAAPLTRTLVERMLAAAGTGPAALRSRALVALAYDTLAVSGIHEGLLFRSVGKAGAIGGSLDAGDVARISKKLAKAAGLAPEEAAHVSDHSSRVGAAQDMVRYGMELPAVMQAGGWRTPEMVAQYTRRSNARRSGSAKMAMLQNRD